MSDTATASVSESSTAFPSLKRQRLNEDGLSAAKETTIKRSSAENSGDNAQTAATTPTTSSTSSGYPSVSLGLQKDPSWMLSDVDSFGGLGPMPPMNTVLEKRASSTFSISSLLPSSVITTQTSTVSAVAATAATAISAADGEGSTTDNEGQTTPAAVAEGSGGNTKYMDPTTGEFMYPENVKPMTFLDKQRLVQKITLLPSQYLRGLMDVISKYQPDTVRQIDDDGYAFDLGQMNENTVWAISDYVKDAMIELDGYIKSIASANVPISTEDRQPAATTPPTATTPTSSAASSTIRHLTSNLALTSSKMSAITSNENQNKFLEQVEMYSKPKVTKSRVKPSKKHECPTCHKQFRGRSELQNHIRTHTGEKPLKCSYEGCTKRYAHSSNLRAHERTHAGVKPYACHYDGCGKKFAHSVSLKEHIWMHAGFQPYECPYEGCSKKFTQVSNFARHKKTHEKEERSENEHSVESDN